MKKIIFSTLALCTASASFAAVGVGLTGGYFYNSSGTQLTSGTLVLVASTTDSVFSQFIAGNSLTENSFIASDDLILKSFTIGSGGSVSSSFSLTLGNFSNLGVSDNLALYWFPTLSVGSTITNGSSYGFYSNQSATADSDPWVMVADGGSITLQFVTNAAGGSSSIPETAGYANLTAVPEPATTVALLGGAAGLFVMYRRRQRKVAAAPAVSAS
jgi:hypothetical protein